MIVYSICLSVVQFQRIIRLILVLQAEILLHIVHTNEADTFTQQSAMLLLNSMAGQVEDKQKQLLGSMGAVEKLLSRITEKLEQGVRGRKIFLIGAITRLYS